MIQSRLNYVEKITIHSQKITKYENFLKNILHFIILENFVTLKTFTLL